MKYGYFFDMACWVLIWVMILLSYQEIYVAKFSATMWTFGNTSSTSFIIEEEECPLNAPLYCSLCINKHNVKQGSSCSGGCVLTAV